MADETYRIRQWRVSKLEKLKKSVDWFCLADLEDMAAERKAALAQGFEWTAENLGRLRELDSFLREKQRLLHRTVSESLEKASSLLRDDPNFLGGEVEICGKLILSESGFGEEEIPGIPEPLLRAMLARLNSGAFSVFGSSYSPVEPYDPEQSEGYLFPEGRKLAGGLSPIRVSETLYRLDRSGMFAPQDLLSLNRELFTLTVTMENAF